MAPSEETASENDDTAPKASKKPLIVGLVGAILFGGGGFFAAYSGIISNVLGGAEESPAASAGLSQNGAVAEDGQQNNTKSSEASSQTDGDAPVSPVPVAAFVEIEPLIVSLGTGQNLAHLRFRGHLEVNQGTEESVASLMPRIMDVLNGYLRAMKPEELSDPTMLIRLRAQMLRRVQLVVGDGLVKDLLVSEFVLN